MNRVTVWHDDNCPLCRREIALMRRLDTRGAITFVDAAGAAAWPFDRDPRLRLHPPRGGRRCMTIGRRIKACPAGLDSRGGTRRSVSHRRSDDLKRREIGFCCVASAWLNE